MTTPRAERVLRYHTQQIINKLNRPHGPYTIDCPDCEALIGEPCHHWCPRYTEAVSVAPRDAQGYS